eukprot:scaffold171961_cov24-Prasinocladus_malaysianus.AAC.1
MIDTTRLELSCCCLPGLSCYTRSTSWHCVTTLSATPQRLLLDCYGVSSRHRVTPDTTARHH